MPEPPLLADTLAHPSPDEGAEEGDDSVTTVVTPGIDSTTEDPRLPDTTTADTRRTTTDVPRRLDTTTVIDSPALAPALAPLVVDTETEATVVDTTTESEKDTPLLLETSGVPLLVSEKVESEKPVTPVSLETLTEIEASVVVSGTAVPLLVSESSEASTVLETTTEANPLKPHFLNGNDPTHILRSLTLLWTAIRPVLPAPPPLLR